MRKSWKSSYDLTSGAPGYNFCHILLVKQVTKANINSRETNYTSMGVMRTGKEGNDGGHPRGKLSQITLCSSFMQNTLTLYQDQ